MKALILQKSEWENSKGFELAEVPKPGFGRGG